MRVTWTGGDGIDFGDGPPAMTNVHVKDVVLDDHLRQGEFSVIFGE